MYIEHDKQRLAALRAIRRNIENSLDRAAKILEECRFEETILEARIERAELRDEEFPSVIFV